LRSAREALEEYRKLCRADMRRLGGDGRASASVRRLVTDPGASSVRLYRVQQLLFAVRLSVLGWFVYRLNFQLHGIEFCPGVEIEGGLVVRHPGGSVLGKGVTCGSKLTLAHGITLGEKYVDSRSTGKYPKIGNGVTLGVGSRVLGDVRVADGATIGAGALVVSDVGPGELAIGVPARVRDA